ncbi:MAG TPA: hypothetical protein VJG30_02255 [Candidatus Nanoarchaeia archaeon]|nr:hypothetical protein [Candidatus Nanoarchaeia archaeon]
MKNIVFDTNFLIYIAKYQIDLFSEIERICSFSYSLNVLSGTIEELEKVKPKELNLIKKYLTKFNVIPSEGNVDDALVEYSEKGCIIGTQDRELKKRLKDSCIVIRQEKYLELK